MTIFSFRRHTVTFTVLQGATKTVSTCPRQMVLATGQVAFRSYLSFGQVDLQKIINKNHGVLGASAEKLVCSQAFASVKQITFRKRNLQVRNKMS